MKQAKYPRIGAIVRHRRCRLCGEPTSDTRIVVQANWRDDAVFPIHAACIEGKKSPELVQILIAKGLI